MFISDCGFNMGFLKKIKLLKYRKNPFFQRFYEEITEKEIEKITFCSLDLETTGLDVKKDEIISVGAVKIKQLKVSLKDTFYTPVKPQKQPSKESILIHGITPKELENAPKPEEVLPQLMEFIKGTVLVGYFIQFDIQILSRYTEKQFGFPVLNPYIDVRQIAEEKMNRSYTPIEKRKGKTLEELAEEYGIPVEQRHNALYDSLITALIFTAMAKKDRTVVEKLISRVL